MSVREVAVGSVAVIGVTALGLGLLLVVTWGLAAVLGDTVSAAILAGAAPLLATFSLGIWSDYREHLEMLEAENRRRRGQAYRAFLRFLFETIDRFEDTAQSNELSLDSDRYGQFLQDLMVWGSDELIELWNEFRTLDVAELERSARHAWMGRLLEQVREDLRGKETDLDADELYELYSVDSEESRPTAD